MKNLRSAYLVENSSIIRRHISNVEKEAFLNYSAKSVPIRLIVDGGIGGK